MVTAIIPVGFDLTPDGEIPELGYVGGRSILEDCIEDSLEACVDQIIILVASDQAPQDDQRLHSGKNSMAEYVSEGYSNVIVKLIGEPLSCFEHFPDEDVLVVWPTDIWCSDNHMVSFHTKPKGSHLGQDGHNGSRLHFAIQFVQRFKMSLIWTQTNAAWEEALHGCAIIKDQFSVVSRVLDPDTDGPLPDTVEVSRFLFAVPRAHIARLKSNSVLGHQTNHAAMFQHVVSASPITMAVSEDTCCADMRYPAEFEGL